MLDALAVDAWLPRTRIRYFRDDAGEDRDPTRVPARLPRRAARARPGRAVLLRIVGDQVEADQTSDTAPEKECGLRAPFDVSPDGLNPYFFNFHASPISANAVFRG